MKQFIEKLRAWKKAYDVFPSMAADREFQEMLDGFTPSNDEGGLPICKECGGHGYILERSGMGEEQEPTKCIECDGKGLVYPTPTSQEPLEDLARRKGYTVMEYDDKVGVYKHGSRVFAYDNNNMARLWLEKLADKEEGK